MAAIHCTVVEIAAALDCDKRTIERNFAAVLQKGREQGKSSLRRAQFKAALGGNATMLIWLGKQLLGQEDRSRHAVTVQHVDALLEGVLTVLERYLPADKVRPAVLELTQIAEATYVRLRGGEGQAA